MKTDNKSSIDRRLRDLVNQGELLVEKISDEHEVEFRELAECVAWMFSAVNVLEVSMPAGSRYSVQATRLLPKADDTFPATKMVPILAILKSAAAEWAAGLIGSLEFHFIGLAFEDFLRLAGEHNENGRHEVAAILASAVLEDTVKRLCRRHDIASEGKTLDNLISALKTKQILGKVKAERLRAHVKVRNQAFHAQWDEFDQRDLRQMIEDLEELIEIHFE